MCLFDLHLRYGTPIVVSAYTNDLFDDGTDIDAASKLAVKNIMGEVERQMEDMTINAPDWWVVVFYPFWL